MRKIFLRVGSLLALVAVTFGAFGAHLLEGNIPVEHFHNFETGVRYHMYHALAILIVNVLIHFRKTRLLIFAGWFFVAGIILFSGSLYLLSIRSILNVPVAILGPITPLGGLCQIVGWVLLFSSSFFSGFRTHSEE